MYYQLINFNIPIKLKDQLDLIAKHKHVSRTAIINIQLEQYCRKELPMIFTDHDCMEALNVG